MFVGQQLRKVVFGAIILGTVAFGSREASAYPMLQLDIGGGVYDLTTETIVATSDPFTLYAMLTPHEGATAEQIDALLARTYYISAALTPKTAPPGGSLGSFVFDGTTVNATSGMNYGVPPLEANLAFDPNDLSKHDVFETYFREFSFTFNPLTTALAYNTADEPGGPTAGTGAYYAAFNVDTTGLLGGYGLHFDLYDEILKTGRTGSIDTDVDHFAPFSHDAECCAQKVPEPGTLLLLGSGVIGWGVWRRWSA